MLSIGITNMQVSFLYQYRASVCLANMIKLVRFKVCTNLVDCLFIGWG